MDDSAVACKVLTAFPPEDGKRPPERPRITWKKTVLMTLNPVISHMAQNHPLVAGCEWHYTSLVVQARNNGDDDSYEHIYSPTKAATQDRQTDMYMDKKKRKTSKKNITELLSAMNICLMSSRFNLGSCTHVH